MRRFRSGCLLLAALTLPLAACEHMGAFEPFREVSCFERARLSLKDAIALAEADGGRTLDADYRQDTEMGCLEGEAGAYDVTLYNGGRITVMSIDARSGQVVERANAGVLTALLGGQHFSGSPSDMVRTLPGLPMTATDAIDAAERTGGKAMVTWIEEKNGMPGYTVKLVEQGRVRVTWIEARRIGTQGV